jgi:hypothetical protein
MKKIKKIAAILLILSLTSGVFTQEAFAGPGWRKHLKNNKHAAELRRDALIGLAGGFISMGAFGYLAEMAESSSNKFVSRILGGACNVGLVTSLTFTLICIPLSLAAAELPRTPEQNMGALYRNPFLLLDKKRFTDYDIHITELKYPDELIKYMDKFQTFLKFSKKENKKNWDKINWILKNQTYLKAGKPKFMKYDGAEDDYGTEMSLQEIMSDEFFYSEFLSYGYWPQFLEVFGEVVSQQRESFEREQRQLAEIAKKKAEILKGFNIKNYCQNLQKLKEGFAGKDILKYSECK